MDANEKPKTEKPKRSRKKKVQIRVVYGNYSFHGTDGEYHEFKAGDVFDASIISDTSLERGLKRGRFEKVK